MNIVEPEVTLIAHTQLAGEPSVERWMSVDTKSTDAEALTTFAGRACYQSFHRPNDKTARDADYLERTLHDQKHFSIAEHASATFYITGVSRALTHELIRHRHLSFSQLSQRFVDESKANVVEPPAVRGSDVQMAYHVEEFFDDLAGRLSKALESWRREAMQNYEIVVNALSAEGLTRKQAREAARAVLPNMVETRIVVTGNLRAWYEVIDRRIQPDADAEIQQVSRLLLQELLKVAPAVFKPLAVHLD